MPLDGRELEEFAKVRTSRLSLYLKSWSMGMQMAVKFSAGGFGFLGRAPKATPEQMKIRKRDQDAAEATKLRKHQTRQKIVLGGSLMHLANVEHDPEARRVLDRIILGLSRDADRALFEKKGGE
jgi:hypothetical protein